VREELPTTLEELVACARRQSVYWSDTANAAAASARHRFDLRPTSSDQNGPFRREDVVERRLPAMLRRESAPSTRWQCMLDITVDQVHDACRKRLGQ
jgi:hypothetical protein